jgi:hypothetical protein
MDKNKVTFLLILGSTFSSPQKVSELPNTIYSAVSEDSLIPRIFDSCPIKYFSVADEAVTVTSQN